MGSLRRLAPVGALMLLIGCSTPYQPEGFAGGYSEVPLAADTFRVTVRGNGFTSPRQVQDMVLLRSAELTRQNGYRRFVVLGMNDTNQRSTQFVGGGATTTFVGSTAITNFTPPTAIDVNKPGTQAVIRMIRDNDPDFLRALDADQVVATVGPRVR